MHGAIYPTVTIILDDLSDRPGQGVYRGLQVVLCVDVHTESTPFEFTCAGVS